LKKEAESSNTDQTRRPFIHTKEKTKGAEKKSGGKKAALLKKKKEEKSDNPWIEVGGGKKRKLFGERGETSTG